MKPRIIFGTVLSAAALLFLLIDLFNGRSLGIFCLVVLFALGAQEELFRMAESKGIRPRRDLGRFLAFALLFFWWGALRARAAGAVQEISLPDGLPAVSVVSSEAPVALAACLFLLLLSLLLREPGEEGIIGAAFNALGLVYVAFLAGFVLEHRFFRAPLPAGGSGAPAVGAHAVILFLVVTKVADTAAYFVGKTVGRRRLAPRLSPKKTCEGLAGALAGGGLAALLYVRLSPLGDHLGWLATALFGILLGFVGQCGDLVESYIKRSFGKKDSSALLPEFGGFLDLIDGVLLGAPFSFVYLSIAGLHPG